MILVLKVYLFHGEICRGLTTNYVIWCSDTNTIRGQLICQRLGQGDS